MTAELLNWILAITTAVLSLLLYAWTKRVNHLEREKLNEDSDDYIRGILNSSTDGIITTDQSGQIRSFNMAAQFMFGYQEQNVLCKSFLFLLPKLIRKEHEKIMSGGSPESDTLMGVNYEIMGRKADSSEFPIKLTVRPINDYGNKGYIGVFRDKSADSQADVEKQKTREMIEYLLQTSPIVLYTRKTTGSLPVAYVSPNVEKVFGYSPADITTTAAFWPQLVHEDDRDLIKPDLKALRRNGHEYIEYRLKLPDGGLRWIGESRTVINNEQGKPYQIIGTWTDIHQEKVARLQTALTVERLDISLKCADMATWDWHINSGEISWSENICEKLGRGADQITNFDLFTSISHPEDNEALQAAYKQCLVKDEALDHEFRVNWPDNSIHWVHMKGEIINNSGGSPVRMAGVVFDITKLKQLRAAPQPIAKIA